MLTQRFAIAFVSLAALAAIHVPASAQWTPDGTVICDAATDQSGVCAASDEGGGAIIVWVDSGVGGDQNLYAKRVAANGYLAPGWPDNGLPVCVAAGSQLTPAMVPDGSGGVYVAWQDFRKGLSDPDIYVQRITGGGEIAPGWPANGRAVCDTVGVQLNPQIASVGQSGAIVVWQDYRNGGQSDIYAQLVSPSGVLWWSPGGVQVCIAPDEQTRPACAPDGYGGVLVAWEDLRSWTEQDPASDIYVQRITLIGNVASGWPANGTPATPVDGARDAYAPTIVSDGGGGCIVCWEDYRGGTGDIYALRLTFDGFVAPGWTVGGIVLCDAGNNQVMPTAIPDGSGGMIAVWEDDRLTPLVSDLFAQRVTGDGAIAAGWPGNGVAVCVSPGIQTEPRVVSDGQEGAVVAWYDYRGGTDTDIYAQRLTGSGGLAPGWSANGVALCMASGDQQVPAAVPDRTGGTVVAWQDGRGANYDVYAQRITGDGVVAPTVSVPGPGGSTFRVLGVRPNPASGRATLAFELPGTRRVEVRIFDLAGRAVRTLEAGRSLPAGPHALSWDGRDANGERVEAGVYLVRLQAGADIRVQRVVRLR